MSNAVKAKDEGLLSTVRDLPRSVWTSIFRHSLPSSELGQAQTTFTNFFLPGLLV